LVQEIALTPTQFNQKFKGSPIKRARRRGYLRNIAIFLGNNPSTVMVPALTKALLDDPEPLVRGHVAWGLAQIGGDAAYQALKAASEKELDAYVQEEIEAALSEF
jgi:epoxyqueuosine reductase